LQARKMAFNSCSDSNGCRSLVTAMIERWIHEDPYDRALRMSASASVTAHPSSIRSVRRVLAPLLTARQMDFQ
jgi:hypothetical protein